MGADLLKLFTGSYVAPGRVKTMRPDIARAAVSSAHARHELAFAHCSNLAGLRVAMDSGVDVIAHAPDSVDGITDATIGDLVKHHMSMIPTLKLFSEDSDIFRIREIVSRFHTFGGRLMFGSDTGFLADYNLEEEYHQLSLCGLTFRDVFSMLTASPAERFGLHDRAGRIAIGLPADLTVLDVDPAKEGLTGFTQVLYTIRGGRIIFAAID
jgi:imidazolonepropionase-like amidohydrolase